MLERSGGLPGNLTEAEGLLARVAPAEEADYDDQDYAELDEQLAAIEPVHSVVFQACVGEEAVKEKSGGSEIDAEVERLPQVAAQPKTQIRSNDHEGEEVESDGADGVFERLAGGIDGIDEIHQAKARVFVQKQNGRVQERQRQGDIAGPVVQAEIVESAMRPRAVGAVAESHEHSEQEVQGNRADRNEADISGKVEDAHAHWRQRASIGVRTARNHARFHEMRIETVSLWQFTTGGDSQIGRPSPTMVSYVVGPFRPLGFFGKLATKRTTRGKTVPWLAGCEDAHEL